MKGRLEKSLGSDGEYLAARLLPSPYFVRIDGYFAITSARCFGIDCYTKATRAPQVCQDSDEATTLLTRKVHGSHLHSASLDLNIMIAERQIKE